MFATLEDLQMSSNKVGQVPSAGAAPALNPSSHNVAITLKRAASNLSTTCSSDEIQVIDEQQPAIPIRPPVEPGYANRHSELECGSVHTCRRHPSPLYERRKQDDLDLLGDSLDSGPCASDGFCRQDADTRGRARGTKRLPYPKPTDYKRCGQPWQTGGNHVQGLHRHRHDVGNGLNGCPYICFNSEDGSHASSGRTPAKHRPLLPPSPFGAEHEAVVFDNFEESGPTTPASEADADAKDPFDTHLRFVRPALPICANPGAFVGLESANETAGSCTDGSEENSRTKQLCNTSDRVRQARHHRAVSELFGGPMAPLGTNDVRNTRRRATIGSDAAHPRRFANLARRGDQSD